ncbi:MAG: hypothetical protein Q9217_000925 [Psora testacea]
MAVITYLLPAVALATTAVAQRCSASATFTVTQSADASQIASCTTYSGSIAIPTDLTDTPDGNGHTSLSIDGVEKIEGNVTIDNAGTLSSLSFADLKSITGLQLGGLQLLSELSMPQIQNVSQMNLTALPALQQFSFGGSGVTQARSILITNTGLSSLQGLDQLETVDSFNVNNNQALQNISLQVSSIKNAINIAANDGFQSGLTTSFPMLQTAMNMTFRNCSSVSLPSLANVSQYLGFYGNTMESFAAPNLTTVGGLVFVDNTELTNISIPNLTSVNGSCQIANNTMLKEVDGLQELSIIAASLDFNGNFTDVQLPALSQVRGAFNLQTSAEFDCSAFDAAKKSKGIIKGNYVCSGSQAKPGGAGTKPSGTSSGSKASSTSAAGHLDFNLPLMLGAASLVSGLFQMIF